MKIEVGEYIRTKRGIAQILEIKTVATKMYGKHDMAYRIDKSRMYITETVFTNHSKNIIDLIEEGDYVNGYKVVRADLESKEYGKYVDVYCPSQNLKLEFLEHVFAEQIKTIVTKEQFAQIEYLVKE